LKILKPLTSFLTSSMIDDHFRIYIAGPITGRPLGNKEEFYAMEARLDARGIDSYNPRREDVPEYCTEYDIQRVMMKMAINHLLSDCDAIVMLEGWEASGGAVIEEALARYLGYAIYDDKFKRLN
jgi:hypothetical protein